MKNPEAFELPEHLVNKFEKAKKLEWITIAYLVSTIVLMYLVMGSSQAMKTAWLEDAMGLLPAISFLIASRIAYKKPNYKFPYGYHRAFSISYLAGAIALFAMGCFLLIDSSISLIKAEHPTIGTIVIFGHQLWLGWIMILALVWASLPSVVIGYKKLPLAKKLHNKILYTDANTQKADYTTAFAAMLGITGLAFGLWWADSAAALFISFSVLNDGYTNLKTAVLDLMDRHPVHVDTQENDDLVEGIKGKVNSWEWVKEADVRFREQGQVYFGEVFIVPHQNTDITKEVEKGLKLLQNYHWKIYQVTIMPVKSLSEK